MSVEIVYTRKLRFIKDKEERFSILKGILEDLRKMPKSVDQDYDLNARS